MFVLLPDQESGPAAEVHIGNPGALDTDLGRRTVQNRDCLYSGVEASLGYMKSCLEKRESKRSQEGRKDGHAIAWSFT